MTVRKEHEGRFFGIREALEADMRAWWHTQDENFVVIRWVSRVASTPRRTISWHLASSTEDMYLFAGTEFASVSLHYTVPAEQVQYVLSRCRWHQHATESVARSIDVHV